MHWHLVPFKEYLHGLLYLGITEAILLVDKTVPVRTNV